MRTIFDKVRIESIQFESGSNEAFVRCKITQNGVQFTSELLIDSTDLNRLIGKIQQQENYTEMSDFFEIIQFSETDFMYVWKTNHFEDQEIELNEVDFIHEVKEIRA
jgi:hypothetical protein